MAKRTKVNPIFQGTLDKVQIYNRTLTTDEVHSMYHKKDYYEIDSELCYGYGTNAVYNFVDNLNARMLSEPVRKDYLVTEEYARDKYPEYFL